MSEEWGPWEEHGGRSVPVSIGALVNAIFDDGDEAVFREGSNDLSESREGMEVSGEGTAGWVWDETPYPYTKIIRYRIRKPKGLQILEAILQDLPETVEA